MSDCKKINWYTILFGALGLAIGFFLNMYANNLSNKKLLEDLKAELQNINHQQQTTKGISPALAKRKLELEGAINILQNK